jgi:hypothetical protein
MAKLCDIGLHHVVLGWIEKNFAMWKGPGWWYCGLWLVSAGNPKILKREN